jgi:hypothetical protein
LRRGTIVGKLLGAGCSREAEDDRHCDGPSEERERFLSRSFHKRVYHNSDYLPARPSFRSDSSEIKRIKRWRLFCSKQRKTQFEKEPERHSKWPTKVAEIRRPSTFRTPGD